MLQWFVGLIFLVILVGFIGFAFRQGMKVTPDRNNANLGPPGAAPPDFGGPSS